MASWSSPPQDKVNPIDTYLDYDKLDAHLVPGMLESARYKGRVYGAPMRIAVKSLVWYPKPATRTRVLDRAVADPGPAADRREDQAAGIAPWCMGWGSDQATGWVGTDWIEELVLRM